ncbi:MAG TPA: ABC transporter permease [Saprospiraceae bacterium]|nr:ABC transporter permease [Saprospiraceae bacterium]HNT19893.1 ABC transporter permease [Saprospiraceae bacterium]
MIAFLLKSSIRLIRRHQFLAILKLSGLAIGMATFLITALFVIHELTFDRQHPDFRRIFRYVHRVSSDNNLQQFAFTSATTGPALIERFQEVESFVRIFKSVVSLKRNDADVGFIEKKFAFADTNFLEIFSFPLRQGYDKDDILKDPYALLLTPDMAKKYFGQQDPIGKTLVLNGQIELTVKGVFRENFSRSHLNFDFVSSFSTLDIIKNNPIVSIQIPASLNLENKGFAAFYTYLKLHSSDQASTLIGKFPAFIEEFRGKGRSERLKPTLQSLESIHLHSDMLYEIDKNGSLKMILIYGIVGLLILAAAIINYVNISMAEFTMRSKGVGLKKILGISRSSLWLSHFMETLVLCFGGLLSGGLLAMLLIPGFNTLMETRISFFTFEMVILAGLIYVVTSILSGSLPAFQMGGQKALVAFKGSFQSTKTGLIIRNALVFIQLLVSFVLLTISMLIFLQIDYLLQKDPGFASDQIIVVNASSLSLDERRSIKTTLGTDKNVVSTSMCSTPPGEPLFTFGATLPGNSGDEDRRLTFYQMFVDEDFLSAMGLSLKEGRFFDGRISADSVNSFVINEAGAKAIGHQAISQRIEIPSMIPGVRIKKNVVGVIHDFHFSSFHSAVEPLLLEFNPQNAGYLMVRFNPVQAKNVIAAIEQAWKASAARLPFNYYFLDDGFARYYAAEQRTKKIVALVTLLTVFLASLGIFGTSLFTMQQRSKEMSLRKLLGSTAINLFALVFRPFLLGLVWASLVGAPMAVWIGNEWLRNYPYHTSFSYLLPVISFGLIAIIIFITLLFYLFRIIKMQPAVVLRESN